MAYDNTGKVYDVSRIIDDNSSLDIVKYRAYSPLFLPYVRFTYVQSLHHLNTLRLSL